MKIDVTRIGYGDVRKTLGLSVRRFGGFHRVGEKVFLEVLPC